MRSSREARQRSSRLLAWLDLHCTSLWIENESFLKEIRSVCWIPIVSRVEDSRLAQSSSKSNRDASTIIPWLDRDNNTMNSPEKTRPHTDIIYVSGVMSIFDGEIRNSALIQLLGWDTSVSSKIVARQLVEFGKSHKALLLKRSKEEEEEQKEEEQKEGRREGRRERRREGIDNTETNCITSCTTTLSTS